VLSLQSVSHHELAPSDEDMALALEEDGRPRLPRFSPFALRRAPGRRCSFHEWSDRVGGLEWRRVGQVRRSREAALGAARQAAVGDEVRVWSRRCCGDLGQRVYDRRGTAELHTHA